MLVSTISTFQLLKWPKNNINTLLHTCITIIALLLFSSTMLGFVETKSLQDTVNRFRLKWTGESRMKNFHFHQKSNFYCTGKITPKRV